MTVQCRQGRRETLVERARLVGAACVINVTWVPHVWTRFRGSRLVGIFFVRQRTDTKKRPGEDADGRIMQKRINRSERQPRRSPQTPQRHTSRFRNLQIFVGEMLTLPQNKLCDVQYFDLALCWGVVCICSHAVVAKTSHSCLRFFFFFFETLLTIQAGRTEGTSRHEVSGPCFHRVREQ